MVFLKIIIIEYKKRMPSVCFYSQLYADNQFVTDLNAEVIGILAQFRFSLIKRRFLNEFRLKLNLSSTINTDITTNNIETCSSTLSINSSSTNLSSSLTSSQNTTNINLSNPAGDISLDIQV